jgi:hypothetical protein
LPLKILSRHLPGGTEKKHKKPQSGEPLSGLRFEPDTFQIQSRSAKHSVARMKEMTNKKNYRNPEGGMPL